MKYFIVTFGCQANKADSERIAGWLENRGMQPAKTLEIADHVIINTCMIRESAENRVYGLVNNLAKRKLKEPNLKIIVTGCMIGMAARDKRGQFHKKVRDAMPAVDEFLPIEEVGFDSAPVRTSDIHAWVPVSNGCNNFCTFCVVPFTRGREVSRPFVDILQEIKHLADGGFKEITLIGQNVNSYGADLVLGKENVHVLRDLDIGNYFNKQPVPPKKDGEMISYEGYKLPNGVKVTPVYVKHLGRLRIPTLFPYLLEEVCKIPGIEKVDFISSNPWDFSDELIEVIKTNKKIERHLHIAAQTGDNEVLKRMNRWYTREEFIRLLSKIKMEIPEMTFSTDIIVGFCGETEEQFQNTVDLVKHIQFTKAYVAMYSDRPMTAAHKAYKDDVPHKVKKKRWQILDDLINQKNLRHGTYTVDPHRNQESKIKNQGKE